mgnify:CR=1 FL=1
MERSDIENHYRENRREIESRLESFESLKDSGEERKFKELVFVILTSQTDAEKAWEATETLENRNLLYKGKKKEISTVLEAEGIQYAEEKSGYIVENRESLSQPTLADPERKLKISQKIDESNLNQSREWFAENVKGMSWKGSSHFLRNIGYGDDFAIISGHIINVLHELGILETLEPPSGKKEYLEIENKFQDLAENLETGAKELDLVLWSMRTGKIFK